MSFGSWQREGTKKNLLSTSVSQMYLHIYAFNQPVLLCPPLLTFFSGHVLKREIYITMHRNEILRETLLSYQA